MNYMTKWTTTSDRSKIELDLNKYGLDFVV
jgi:hypothetical protein